MSLRQRRSWKTVTRVCSICLIWTNMKVRGVSMAIVEYGWMKYQNRQHIFSALARVVGCLVDKRVFASGSAKRTAARCFRSRTRRRFRRADEENKIGCLLVVRSSRSRCDVRRILPSRSGAHGVWIDQILYQCIRKAVQQRKISKHSIDPERCSSIRLITGSWNSKISNLYPSTRIWPNLA